MKAREYMVVCSCNVYSENTAILHMKGRIPNRGINRELLPYWVMLILLVT